MRATPVSTPYTHTHAIHAHCHLVCRLQLTAHERWPNRKDRGRASRQPCCSKPDGGDVVVVVGGNEIVGCVISHMNREAREHASCGGPEQQRESTALQSDGPCQWPLRPERGRPPRIPGRKRPEPFDERDKNDAKSILTQYNELIVEPVLTQFE